MPTESELYEIEVLDGEFVEYAAQLRLESAWALSACRRGGASRSVQTAVAAATGFVAGAATMALLRRYGQARLERTAATPCRRWSLALRPGAHLPGVRAPAGMTHEVRVQLRPLWPFRLTRRSGMDGLSPVRRGVLHRLLHERGVDGEEHPVHVRVAQLSSGDILIGAAAERREFGERAIVKVRRALGVDLDLRAFHDEFRRDPLIGAAVRANPTLRPSGRPDPFEALAWAVTEQLIEYERAAAIQRRMVAALGRRHEPTGLRDSPSATVFAGTAPARLEAFDLSASRSVALVKVAREAAAGRVGLDSADPAVQESGWRRLRTIPGIGSWTVEILALTGQGRLDQIPAGDLGLIKLVGRLLSGGDPWARADEQQVRDFFARFGRWQGLAASYALRVGGQIKSPIASGRLNGSAASSPDALALQQFVGRCVGDRVRVREQLVPVHPGPECVPLRLALVSPDLEARREEVRDRGPQGGQLERLLRSERRDGRDQVVDRLRGVGAGGAIAARQRLHEAADHRGVVDDRALGNDDDQPVVGRRARRAQ